MAIQKKNTILTLLAAFVLSVLFAIMTPAEITFAEPDKPSNATDMISTPYNNGTAAKAQTDYANSGAVGGLVATMYKFAKYIAGLIFGVSAIVIVWAGFKYATSQGEAKVTEQAKMQIISAGIGMGVALLAMVIVSVFSQIYQ